MIDYLLVLLGGGGGGNFVFEESVWFGLVLVLIFNKKIMFFGNMIVWRMGSEKCFGLFGCMFIVNSCNVYGEWVYVWVFCLSSFIVCEIMREMYVRNVSNVWNMRNVKNVRNVINV